MSKKAFVLIAALLAFCAAGVAQDDPIMGTWKINKAKTKLPAGESAEALTRVHEPIPNGIKITRPLVDKNGKATRGTWTLYFDGKDYPVPGDPNLDTLSLKRIDRYTMEAIAKKDGVIHNRMRWDVTKDGKSLTWTSNRVLPKGREGTFVRVYEKE